MYLIKSKKIKKMKSERRSVEVFDLSLASLIFLEFYGYWQRKVRKNLIRQRRQIWRLFYRLWHMRTSWSLDQLSKNRTREKWTWLQRSAKTKSINLTKKKKKNDLLVQFWENVEKTLISNEIKEKEEGSNGHL